MANYPHMAVFTVVGTSAPHGGAHGYVLYPQMTCSCLATCECYHIGDAKLAVGLTVDEPAKLRVNLTTLCRNKRKNADQTSGHKHPRTGHVEVVPAADAAVDAELRRLQSIVLSQPNQPIPVVTPTTTVQDVPPRTLTPPPLESIQIDVDIYHGCNAKEPPVRKSHCRGNSTVDWVQCNQCPRWYHIQCVGLKVNPDIYICDVFLLNIINHD